MGLGAILILLLLIVSLIVFIYIIVMTARGWGVLHTILLCTLFIECWVFMVFSAGVQYRRVRHTRDAFQAQKQADEAAAETHQLLYGGFDMSESTLEAVIPVKGMLRRLTADRGRVWRGLNFIQENNGEFLLEMTAGPAAVDPLNEDAGGGAAAAPLSSESLPANLVVYSFVEEQGEDGYPKPVFYLGEFVVSQSQGGQVTLRPTLPLRDFQQQRIAAGAATWMLYELLPIDSHTAFAAEGSQGSNEAIFGRMDPDSIAALFADVPESLRAEVIDAYVRDGLPASPDDEPNTIWIQVNMLQNHEVEVDSSDSANATVSGYFDAIGRSVDARLKRDDNEKVQLTPNMQSEMIILKEPAAQELIAAGKAELVQRFYVRPLNDYEEAFNRNIVRQHELAERITLVKRESAEIEKANQLGNEMISFRQVENQKLVADLDGFKKELDVLNAAAATATQELTDLKARMSLLYRNIQARHAQMGQ
ncbi:MAG: hypothetical protein R3C53_25805 [Pirellulaceae bacterium]